MLMIHVPESDRPKPGPCRHCGANGAACESLHWLRAQTCCDQCDGTHKPTTQE